MLTVWSAPRAKAIGALSTDLSFRYLSNITATTAGGRKYKIELLEQRTGFGYKKLFVCPRCGAIRANLYGDEQGIGCRGCLTYRPYRRIQNTTNGIDDRRLLYTVEKIARKNGLEISDWASFDPLEYIANDRRPKYMRHERFGLAVAKIGILNAIRMDYIFSHGVLAHKFKHIAAADNENMTCGDIGRIERAQGYELLDYPIYLAVRETQKKLGYIA